MPPIWLWRILRYPSPFLFFEKTNYWKIFSTKPLVVSNVLGQVAQFSAVAYRQRALHSVLWYISIAYTAVIDIFLNEKY